eukprot:1088687-Prymnesium_polylepis.2
MAETLANGTQDSFKLYAFQFCRVLVSMRCANGATAPPLNVLGWPYHIAYRGCKNCLTVFGEHAEPRRTMTDRRETVMQKINEVRANILEDPTTKQLFQRSIARIAVRHHGALDEEEAMSALDDIAGKVNTALEPVKKRLEALEGTLNRVLAAVSTNAGGGLDRGGVSTSAPLHNTAAGLVI